MSSFSTLAAAGRGCGLDCDAVITSTDRTTGQAIRVRFTGGIATWEPPSEVPAQS